MEIYKKFRCNPKNKWLNFSLIYLAFLGFFYTTSAFAADLLGDALTDIKANFGVGSVFIKVLYLMEIYYGWRKYRETHNPFAVGSIVLVAFALTYAIGKWVK
ncbi:MAG: hypothetical protein WCH10_05475 [bacterium]